MKKKGQILSEMEIRKKIKLTDIIPFSVKEAYKLIRTNILFSLPEEGCKCIAITSPYPLEGKTTTAINVALSFVKMGEKTLLIDGNMRNPEIHNIFGLDNREGLSNVLSGLVKIEEAIHYDNEGLDIMTAGNICPNPTEILSSHHMRRLLHELEEKYEYIFIDTPSINVVADAMLISRWISGVIVVTKKGYSTHPELQTTLNKLNYAKAKVLGLVLTNGEVKSKRGKKQRSYESCKGIGHKNSANSIDTTNNDINFTIE